MSDNPLETEEVAVVGRGPAGLSGALMSEPQF
jgi:hypothetical protein